MLYAAGLLMTLRAILATGARVAALTFDGIYGAVGSILAVTVALILWSVVFRSSPAARWFVSHAVWLAMSFAGLLIAIAVAPLVMFAGLLFVAVFPPLAYIAVYGPFAIGIIAFVWFVYRMIRGYSAFLKGYAIGVAATPDYATGPSYRPPRL